MPPAPTVASLRLPQLDALRGVVMAVMAIDHVSYFVAKRHVGEFWGHPLPQHESAGWFLTRFVTHLSAPGFFFLMGAGMLLFAESRRSSGWSESRIRGYWIKRGALLIVLQQFVENPAWILGELSGFSGGSPVPGDGGGVILHLGVLYGLGASLILGAFLMRVPAWGLALVAVGAIGGTALITPGQDQVQETFSRLQLALFTPGRSGMVQVYYPAVPWLGVTALGMLFGRALRADAARTLRLALGFGAAALMAFAALRFAGPVANVHPPATTHWIDILNVTKYPPAPTFILLTLGINLVLLGLLSAKRVSAHPAVRPLVVLGQAALFFYIAHLYFFGLVGFAFPRGSGLAGLYLAWAAGIVVLWFLSRRYRTFKFSRPPESYWRLF